MLCPIIVSAPILCTYTPGRQSEATDRDDMLHLTALKHKGEDGGGSEQAENVEQQHRKDHRED